MGARRKLEHDRPVAARAVPRPALAGLDATAVDSPVHEHLARLQASFIETDAPPPYPRAVRLAIMVVAPAALWALVILSVGALARAAGA